MQSQYLTHIFLAFVIRKNLFIVSVNKEREQHSLYTYRRFDAVRHELLIRLRIHVRHVLT